MTDKKQIADAGRPLDGGVRPGPEAEPALTEIKPKTFVMSLEFLERIYRTLDYYANVCTYQGERTGGVLKWCPRAPTPTARELVIEARRMVELLEAAYKDRKPVVTNAAGPEHLAPRPAPGLEFDERGVLVPVAERDKDENRRTEIG